MALGAGVGCKKNEPPPPAAAAKAKEATPIPEGFAFNEFLGDAPAAGDGGAATGGGTAEQGGPGGAQEEVKVLEPGAEPRAKLRYELKVGKTERVKVQIKPEVEQVVEGRGSQRAPQPAIEFTMAVTPKERMADGSHRIEAKLLKLSLAMGQTPEEKQMAQMLAPALKEMEGVAAIVTMSGRGGVSDVQFSGDKVPQAAGEFLPFVAQAFEMLAAPLPDEPVGEGARWEHVTRAIQDGVPAKMTATMQLKKRAGNAITLDVETKREGKGEITDPRVPEGMSVERSGTGQFVYQLNLDGAPVKVDGSATSVDIIKDPSTRPPRSITTRAKVTQTLTRI
jgi:hypothetical protein